MSCFTKRGLSERIKAPRGSPAAIFYLEREKGAPALWAAGLQIAGSVLPTLSYILWKAYFSGFSFTSARFFGFIFSVPMMPSLVLEAST